MSDGGKGSAPRPTDQQKFNENWTKIFRKHSKKYQFGHGNNTGEYHVLEFPEGIGEYETVNECKKAAESYFQTKGLEPKFMGMIGQSK